MAGLNLLIITLIISGASHIGVEEQIHLKGDFKAQVKAIVEQRTLKNEDHEAINDAVDDIKRVLQTRWPDVKLMPFGSVFTELGTPDSDIDIYVSTHHPIINNTAVEEAASILRQYPEQFADIRVKGRKIPKACCVHRTARRKIELSFIKSASIRNTRLINYFFSRDSTVLNLAIIIKYWTKIHKLDVNISHYIFTVIVMFFLQQKGVLLSIADLQKNVQPIMVDHWNTAFEERIIDPPNEDLFDLMVDFFQFYSNFDYSKDVISPFAGYPVSRAKFEDARKLPKNFELYKHNVANNITRPLVLNSTIVVQDPFNHNRNVGFNIHEALAKKIIMAFRIAYDTYLVNNDPDEYLKLILQE